MADKLNTFLATHSYIGDDSCATKEDYKVCASLKDVNEKSHPHLARWHAHIVTLMAKYPNFDWRGTAVPAGKNRVDGAAAASPAQKPAKAPASPAQKPTKAPAAKAAAAPAAAGGAVDEAAVKAVGDEIRVLKEKLKGEGITGKKLNDHADVAALVAKLAALKTGAAAAPAAAPAKKEEAKKAEPKKGGKKEEPKKEEKAVDPAEARKKQLKTAIKEGGKRGVEIEGAADMGGLQFFCTAVESPDGDIDILRECVNAMNAKSDPTEEERKGGSGAIGKMIFSAGTHQLAVAAYVPDAKQGELSCEEWLKAVLANFSGSVVSADKSLSLGVVKTDSDKGVFPLKIREALILEANNFLRKKGLFPEDDGSDDDEFVFGDDDFPSM